jgi:hypothetical protein
MTADATTILRKRLKAAGYSPIPVTGKIPSGREWQDKLNVTDQEIENWSRWAGLNTGVITTRTPAFDIDIKSNAEAASAVEQLARQQFAGKGKFLVRVGLPPKRLIPFRADAPFQKIAASLLPPGVADTDPNWRKKIEKVEFLCDRQQFVAFGVHPDTGNPYAWNDVGDPSSVSRDQLPAISAVEARALVDAAAELLVTQFGYRRVKAGGGKRRAGKRARQPKTPNESVSGNTNTTPLLDYEATSFFDGVNARAMQDMSAWAPGLFPGARFVSPTLGWRVSSKDLGRHDLEEDLSIHPKGIVDFGVADMGDPYEGSRTPIDLVMEWSGIHTTPIAAAFWLCQRLGIQVTASAPRKAEVPLDQARAELEACITGLMTKAIEWHALPQEDRPEPPHAAIKITTGGGKSEQTRKAIATVFIPEMKRRGLPHRVLFLVPTHRLGAEARSKMPKGVTSALWQGREAKDVKTGEPLCLNLDAVKTAVKLGADVEKAACKGKRGGQEIKCPHFDQCLYQRQKAVAKQADIIFAAHETGFRLQKSLGKNFGLVIIDEQSWQRAGLSYKGQLAVEGLGYELKEFPVLDHAGNVDADATAHLSDLISRLQIALRNAPEGYLSKQHLLDAGLLPSTKYEDGSCKRAVKYEWARKVEIDLRPDDSQETRNDIAERNRFQGQIKSRAAMWRALDELLSGEHETTGRLYLLTDTSDAGSVRYINVRRRKELHKDVLALPIVHMDATLDIEIVRYFMPRAELVLDIEVEAPHQRIVQVVGKSTAKTALKPGDRSDDEEQRIANFRQNLVDLVRLATIGGQRGLVITYEVIEPSFKTIGNVDTGHFNAIAGIDRWRDVDVAFVIGRPDAPAHEVVRIASALTGRPVVIEKRIVNGKETNKIEVAKQIRLKDGSVQGILASAYEDPGAELVRRWITESELVQAVGRVRGVNRTASDPVTVLVMCYDGPFAGTVDQVVEWDNIKPDVFDRMLLTGLVPASPTDASKLFPDLFESPAAAQQAYWRAGLSVDAFASVAAFTRRWLTNPYKNLYREMSATSPRQMALYRLSGAGQRPRAVFWDARRLADPEAVLTAALGSLASFHEVPQLHLTAPAARTVREGIAASVAAIFREVLPATASNVVWLAARSHAAASARAAIRVELRQFFEKRAA